ncbi:hypothetical protein E3N88_04305 [Mikania micrantha]|uniref:Uncharacterized protein n=1 Tax=Mikania micrantha TaxID=192012 RepID=A0A5N6PVB2_9ASTR|nr:hypothetical protein E3N88_04305 [Mikania micrantha]
MNTKVTRSNDRNMTCDIAIFGHDLELLDLLKHLDMLKAVAAIDEAALIPILELPLKGQHKTLRSVYVMTNWRTTTESDSMDIRALLNLEGPPSHQNEWYGPCQSTHDLHHVFHYHNFLLSATISLSHVFVHNALVSFMCFEVKKQVLTSNGKIAKNSMKGESSRVQYLQY